MWLCPFHELPPTAPAGLTLPWGPSTVTLLMAAVAGEVEAQRLSSAAFRSPSHVTRAHHTCPVSPHGPTQA